MKKVNYLLFSFIMLTNFSKAQNAFGLTAGTALASYKVKAESVSITSDTKAGFTVGALYSISVGKSVNFQPALNFVQKGGTFKEEMFTDKTTLNYLELPLNLVYHTKSSAGNFFVGAGPCLSLGLSGKDKWDDGGDVETTDIKFGSNDEDDFKPLEVGLNVLAGYQFKKGFLIAANYNAGLNNVGNIDTDISEYHNRYIGIRVGFMFNKK
ncbi:hypothetical protein BH10BAC2_BH10BAC2_49050 [soil metagenome]